MYFKCDYSKLMQLFVLTALCLPGASFTSSHKSLTNQLPTLTSLFNTNDLSGKLVAGCAVSLFFGTAYYLNEQRKMRDISDLLTNPELKPGDTALHRACEMGKSKDIKRLLHHEESKDFIDTYNAQGEYPIHTACLNKKPDALALLLSKNLVSPNALTQSGETPLSLMCESINPQGIISQKDIDILNTLLHHGAQYMDDKGTTFIEWITERNLQHLFQDQISLSTNNQNIVAEALESSESDNPLNDACKKNDIKKAMILLENQETYLEFAYKRDDDGRMAMHNAYFKENFDILELFLNKGLADIPTNNGESLLDFVFRDPTKPFNRKVLNALLHHNARYIQHGTTTVLHKACEYGLIDVVEQQLASRQPVFCETETEDLPLHIVCRQNNLDMVKLLLTSEDHVAHLNHQNIEGQTPLYVACASNAQSEIITTLLQKEAEFNSANAKSPEQEANLDHADAKGITPLHIACFNNNIRVVRTLLESPIVLASINKHNKDGHTFLSWACVKNLSCEIITALIQGGADPGIVDLAGNTPLHIACQKSHANIIPALLDSPNVSGYINHQDRYGNTPLHWACAKNAPIQTIRALLQRGANVGMVNLNGNTPLHIACLKSHANIIPALLDSPNVSEYINLQGKFGDTPLHWACANNVAPDIITTLIEKGANVRMFNLNGDTPLHIACQKSHANIIATLLDSPNVSGYINHQNTNGDTPLHWACANNVAPGIIAEMIEKGADAGMVNSKGNTPLHIACQTNLAKIIPALLDSPNVSEYINHQNINGDTPLHWTCANILEAFIDRMLQLGADPNKVNEQGDTPLHIACRRGSYFAIKTLLCLPNVSTFINHRNIRGETPLDMAKGSNRPPFIINKLVALGAL
jgi:ankyrin repeat protein